MEMKKLPNMLFGVKFPNQIRNVGQKGMQQFSLLDNIGQ